MRSTTSHHCTTTTSVWLLGVVLLGQVAVHGQFIPRDSPPSYVDDVYHCLDPFDVDNNLLDCNSNTWRWDRTQLLPDSPPTPCITEWNVDITSFLEDAANNNETEDTTNTVYVVEDRFEPCALWMMAYGPFENSNTTNTNTTIDEEDTMDQDMLDGLEDDSSSTRPATNIPNDLYHCLDPSRIDLETNIPCNPLTYEWDLDALVPFAPPPICQGRPSLIGASNLPDYLEPCVFWTLKYGTLDGSSSGSSGTAAPSSLPPDSNESLDGIVVIDPLLVTLMWPSQIFSSSSSSPQEAAEAVFSLDRNELRDITERHVLEALLAGLGDSILATVNIILTSDGIPTQGTWKERLTGTVTLQEDGAQLPSSTVNRLIQEAFVGTARELYQFRLQIANDPTLRQLQSVRIEGESSTNVFDNNNFDTANNNGDDDDDENGLDQVLIIVIASCAAALVAVCASGYCLFLYATHQVTKKAEAQAQALAASRSYKSSVASSSRASRVSIYNLPMVQKTAKASTTSALGERPIHEGDYEDDDEENQMSLISMSAFGDYDAERGGNGNNNIHQTNKFGDDHSAAGTSVYSYFNHADNTTTGGGTSTAEDQSLTNDTFLASIIDKRGGLYDDESTLASYSPVSKKKTFSVLDTLSKYGDIAAIWRGSKRGSDNDDEDDYNAQQQLQQQDSNDEDYIAGLDDPLPLDVDQSSQANHTAGSESGAFSVSMDDVEDYQSEMGGSLSPATMPVKERMEQMWAQDDETKTIQTKEEDDDVENKESEALASSSQTTKGRHFKVFQDDGSGGHSGSGSGAAATNTSFDSDDSPASTLQSSKARSGATVNLLPTDHDGEEDDDASADGMALRLPNQLQTEHYMNIDAMSQSSSLSSRSGRSNRSSGSVGGLDNKYGAAVLKAQAATLLQHQGDLSDGEQGSVRSSDSDMYRSLLTQDDTNDAPLFGKDQGKSSQQKQPQQLSNLIQSFDDVWSKDEKDGKEQPVPVSRSSSGNDIDSDEDDIYLEADDEDEPDDAQSDANSITSGASRVVQELSSLLLPGMQLFSTPAKDDQDFKDPSSPELPGMNLFTHSTSDGSKENNRNAQDPSPNKVMDFPDPTQSDDKEQPTLEGKLSFEIQDSDDDDESVGMHDPSAAAAQETAHVARNMERLRRLSLSGYAETMASF